MFKDIKKELSSSQEKFIKERDSWTCQKCGFNSLNLEVCYIVPFEKCKELYWPVSKIKHPHNLILLCLRCRRSKMNIDDLPMATFNNLSFKKGLQRKAEKNTKQIGFGFPNL